VYSGGLYIAQPKGRMTIIAGTRLVMKKDGGDPVYGDTALIRGGGTARITRDGAPSMVRRLLRIPRAPVWSRSLSVPQASLWFGPLSALQALSKPNTLKK
jgi:hypothetical protein